MEPYESMVTTWRCLSVEGYEIESPPLSTPGSNRGMPDGGIRTSISWNKSTLRPSGGGSIKTCPQPADTVIRLWDPIPVEHKARSSRAPPRVG